MCEELQTLFLNSEEAYIQKFCEVYCNEIVTPDGFTVFCKYLEKTAKHFCCGKKGVYQKTRAQRVLWAKYILMHPNERIVLNDIQTNNTLFFLTRRKKAHLVVCNRLGNKFNLISSFAVGGFRADKYRKGEPPYEFYKFS